MVDEGCDPSTDADGDGYAAMSVGGPDCDDTNPLIHPGAPEHCGDGVDDNCNGVADDGCDQDTDGDGWAEPPLCEGNPAVHPGVSETCDGVDDDCNGTIDDLLAAPTTSMSGNPLPEGSQGCVQEGCSGSPSCAVDYLTDPNNCGGCRISCAGIGDRCLDGACDCSAASVGTHPHPCGEGRTCCVRSGGGGCFDLQIGLRNCGACGRDCNVDASGVALPDDHAIADTCSAGTCACGAGSPCAGDTGDGHYSACCGGACTDLATDAADCGGCGIQCGPNQHCEAGACACNPPFEDCDHDPSNGCESNPDTDTTNCGACGTLCARANAMSQCVGGMCMLQSCNPGYADCDGNDANGCETIVDTDRNNCGTCGHSCSAKGNSTCCAGGCVDTSSDNNNCGTCGNACRSGQACAAGVCG